MVFAKGESHKQDGEMLAHATQRMSATSGDPAMAFEPFVGSPGLFRPGRLVGSLRAAGLDNREHTGARSDTRAGTIPRETNLATDTETLDQALVAPLVGALEIVEQLTALGHELQQPAP
jgi:hypothetical protein